LYIDRQEFGTKILKLPLGAEKELTFTWRATHGKHKLKLVIDPYDTIIESYEDNNFVEKQIDVCEKASTGLFANWDKIELPFILMIITCIAIVTIIILLLIRRGSSTLG
jgi:subtilase family serine protease